MPSSNHYMSREDAIRLLYTLINSCILADEFEADLEELANIIQAEREGLHIWEADADEVTTLHTAVREDLITDDYLDKCRQIRAKYSFANSPFEAVTQSSAPEDDAETSTNPEAQEEGGSDV